MSKKEQNIIKVLEAMSKHSYALYEIFKADDEDERASKYIKESSAYDIVISMIENNKDLKYYARIFKIDIN